MRFLDATPPNAGSGSELAFTAFPDTALNHGIFDRFQQIAARFPDRVAIDDLTRSLPYQELDRLARRIAAIVNAAVSDRPGPVAILLPNEPRYTAAMLGVMVCRRPFVPLNAQHPAEHNLTILAHAGVAALLSDRADLALLGADLPPGVVTLDLDASASQAEVPPARAQPDDLACIAYTSGSTGQPKGVERHHRALLHYAKQTITAMQIRPSDTLVSFNGPSLTEGLIVTLSALLSGASVHCMSPAGAEPAALVSRLRARGATVLWTVPRLFRYLVDALPPGQKFDSLRLVSLAGDRVDWRDIDTVRRGCVAGTQIRVGFGSTEAGVHAQWFVDESIRGTGMALPVGREPPGQQLRLLGEDGMPVPDGEPGEVEVTSASVSKAYWRDPAATARAFTEVPGDPSVRRYRTGDLARRRRNGLIEYVGRKDSQIKLRGQRVELSQVETALLSCPGVRDAAVTVRSNAAGVPRSLLAWCEPERDGATPDTRNLLALLGERLPRHMVPAALEIVGELPRLANFKIDREALRLRDEEAARAKPADTPTTPTEVLLAALWTDAFDAPVVARDDDFFELGGDSLAAATIAAGVKQATGKDMQADLLATHPTLAGLAAALDDSQANNTRIPLAPAPRESPPPMAFVQEIVWRTAPTADLTAPYCDTTAYRLRGRLNVAALRAAIAELIARHEAFRTTFDEVDGRPMQIVHHVALSRVADADVSASADPRAEARRLVEIERRRLADLREGPLVRFLLIRLGEAEHWLAQSTNHIVMDAGSRTLFLQELGLSYDARARGLPSPLAPYPPLQFGDYAAWQRHAIGPNDPECKAEITWWALRMASVPPRPALPFERASPVLDADVAEATIRWSMQPDTARRTTELARQQRTTPFAVRVAALAALLAAETGSQTVVLLTNTDRRDRVELRETIGNFLNAVMLRLDCDFQLPFATWVGSVGTVVAEAVAHGTTPFWLVTQVLAALGISCAPSMTVHSFVLGRLALDGIDSDIVDRESTGMPDGVTLAFREHDEDRDCSLAFDARRHDPARVRGFRDRFVSLLDAALTNPDRTLAELTSR